ncbi:MAG: hypothetical protein M0Q53_16440 [Prolixibacteraceae bacterium]|jgi:hypothetical protein|nr:hypothetical protein [Prolixibacteraceae bacterium]
MKYCTRKWIAYLFTARHRKGHGIHSPFLFRLITEVIENKGNFSAWPMLVAAEENVRNTLWMVDKASYRKLYETKIGADCGLVRKLHLLPGKFDRLIFRLVNEFQPRLLSFYGSTFGVTLMAMALADRRIRLVAQVENGHYQSFCRRLIEVYEIGNIDLSGAGKVIASDFVVIQFPLDPAECSRVLAQIVGQPYEGVIILYGIHTSAEMEGVWGKFQKEQQVRISLDLFEIGIFICKKGLQKEDFVLRF